jgi:hypothetical protein
MTMIYPNLPPTPLFRATLHVGSYTKEIQWSVEGNRHSSGCLVTLLLTEEESGLRGQTGCTGFHPDDGGDMVLCNVAS